MHRFMNVKKFYISNVNLPSASGEMQYTRTCTLCNRISGPPLAGRLGVHRVHSTWLNPERSVVVINKKKKYKVRNVASPTIRVEHRSTAKQRTRITLLDSKEVAQSGDNYDQLFFTSSSSSPVLSGSRLSNIGITLMFPPSSSKTKDYDSTFLKSLVPSSSHTFDELPSERQSAALSQVAAELMLNGLKCRLLAPYASSEALQGNSKEANVFVDTSNAELLNGNRTAEGNGDAKELLLEPDALSKKIKVSGISKKSHKIMKEDEIKDAIGSDGLEKKVVQVSKKEKKEQLHSRLQAHRVVLSKLKRIVHRASYIDVCANSGKKKHALLHAEAGLNFFSEAPDRNKCLEPLFSLAAQENDVNGIHDLVSMARSMEVNLSVPSYVVSLELMGRLPKSAENSMLIKVILENMEDDGVKIDDIIAKCQGRSVLINKILRAVHTIDPDYMPSCLPSPSYHVNLLSSLNDTAKAKAQCYHSPVSGLLFEDSVANLVDEQIAFQNSTVVKIKNISCDLSDVELEKYIEKQKKVESVWRESIAVGFQNDLKALGNKKSNYRLTNYLRSLPVETFVDIIIQEVHNRFNDSDKISIGLKFAQRNLGKRVKELYDMNILKKYGNVEKARDAHVTYCKWYAEPERYPQGPSKPREIWESVVNTMEYDDCYSSLFLREWTSATQEGIGKFLYNILLKDVKIDENIETINKTPHMVPALYIVFRRTTKGYQKQLKMHPAVHRVFQTKMQPYLSMTAFELPMVCPPRPWVSINSGVYPLTTPSLQRNPDTERGAVAMAENIESVPTQQLYPCFDSLNQLSSIPWKVNAPVLDVVTEVFKSGGSKILSIPKPPSAASAEPAMPANASLCERIKTSKERSRIRQENAEMYSLWCDTLYKLSIAHEFRNRTFWLPHNMDFRGRVYPICPHLQHMSNDMARSVLCFAKGEKLGSEGLNWLKLHLINLTGLMSKQSLAARVSLADEIMPKILDSAEKPLTGDKWWMESEEPWQTLAACLEIAAAIKSGDPENYVSHYPIHQDGSCNGLQHYAALGRDTLGAKSVNLVDTEKPSDVYLCVSDLVEQQRAKDANEGNALAQSLEGFICRKVVKQTIMTVVYGVTNYGAQLQIQGRLKDMDYPEDKTVAASAYIAKLVFQSLGEMFTSSRNIQDWLTQCASGIVKSKVSAVQWVTPLGLPVIQPYFKGMSKKSFVLQVPEHQWFNTIVTRIPNSQKHRNAFSPNFIHSLDSCHMMMTGLHCEQSNITFVSVHDCYWVHAKNVNAMSKICREQFVALHSEPILEDLSKYLICTFVSGERVMTRAQLKQLMTDNSKEYFQLYLQKEILTLVTSYIQSISLAEDFTLKILICAV